MKRREFLHRAACAAGAAWLHPKPFGHGPLAMPALSRKFSASDSVTLGSTGIQTSRLAMGTGTVGSGHHSHQTALGIQGLSELLLNGYDHGLRFFDTADSYGSHPHVVCLMHCLTEGDWTERFQPVMDVLSEAKQKGIIRAHGCSCHSIEALRTATKSPWVQVHLVRVNPVGAYMDAAPETVVDVLREMRLAKKAIIGMKILGQGEMRNRQDEALNFALGLNLLDAFTIGAESKFEQEDLIHRIAAA